MPSPKLAQLFFTLSPIAVMALFASCTTVAEPGYISLFNGKDLTGWQYKPGNNITAGVFDGQTASNDKRYTVADGIMIVHDRDRTDPKQPTRVIYTVQKYSGDFILKLQFRAAVNADSGIFIGTKQLQCRDYLKAGPYLKLTQYKPQDWNQIEIVVHGTKAHCTCNGEVLEDAMPLPPPPWDIGLEADRGPTMEYRNIELKPLPAAP